MDAVFNPHLYLAVTLNGSVVCRFGKISDGGDSSLRSHDDSYAQHVIYERISDPLDISLIFHVEIKDVCERTVDVTILSAMHSV